MQSKLLLVTIPLGTSVKGTLFLEFCEQYFGPHSPDKWWGRPIMTRLQLMRPRALFRELYYEKFEERSGIGFESHIFNPNWDTTCGYPNMDRNLDPRINWTDLLDFSIVPLRYTLVGEFPDDEQKNISLFICNVEKFLLHERMLPWQTSKGGVQMNLSDPRNYGIGVRGEHDITPTNSSNALLWEKD